jgi:deoxyribodipyrimidine photo-lyase
MILKPHFPTNYQDILERIASINPIEYARSRNHISGAVTHISPYLTHGVISLPKVRDIVLQKYTIKESYTFIFELAWREFFQRVYAEEGEHIFEDLKSKQLSATKTGIPTAALDAKTGIQAIDTAYTELYRAGYMHNHARMWSAMLLTNIGHYKWWDVGRHMFYHLLDGDKASNTLSWQWVAGTFSSKQYLANQDMIHKFTRDRQTTSYLNVPVESLTSLTVPELETSVPFSLTTDFSLFGDTVRLETVTADQILLYSIWTLDPNWSPVEGTAKKVLCIDQDELTRFPISPMRIAFIRALANNIPDLRIVLCTASELSAWSKLHTKTCIYRKDHPALSEWPGKTSAPEYLFPQIPRVPRGFMSYWKKCEEYLYSK